MAQKKMLTSVNVIIEIPKGSRNKYEYDKEKNVLKFDRMLFSAVHYPSDYGYIPETLAQDKDPLDALVLAWEPTFPGCLIEAKPVGLFKMWDEKGPDEKILCVPLFDLQRLEKKKTGVEGWEDRESAVRIIEEARKCYRNHERMHVRRQKISRT